MTASAAEQFVRAAAQRQRLRRELDGVDAALVAAVCGLEELRRAYDGHDHTALLRWPDGTCVLAAGGTPLGMNDPFEGYDDLAFVSSLGVPEALGWQGPDRPEAAAPDAPATPS